MDHRSCRITRRRPLDLGSRGLTEQDFKEPWGIRTPNGQIWAHDLDDLYDVRPSKGWRNPVYWSVSMVREFELASKDMLEASKTQQQRQQQAHSDNWKVSPKKPWPLLRFPEKVQRQQNMGTADEKLDYCRNLHHDPWIVKSFHSDEDYHVINLKKILGSVECFCGYCEDLELRVPTSSLYCVKRHFDLHCKCQNRRELMKKSKSFPDICYVMNHRESDHFSASKFSQCQHRQRSMDCLDTEKIPYSTETIAGTKLPPKLEEFIPNNFLPNILVVNDDDDCATGEQGLRGTTPSIENRISEERSQHRYHRVLPATQHEGPSPERELRTGYVDLSRTSLCGTGSHSSVYRASFLPPPPLTTNFRSLKGYVTVIAKTAFPSRVHRAHLDNEAEVLTKLSTKDHRHMQQEWCGFNLLPDMARPVPVGPVVPKFYGYYKPQPHETESTEHLSPILLVEDCGVPIQKRSLSQENKEEIYSLFLRLHQAFFTQNSPFVRNILIQLGPLTRPPVERSLTTPSFRIIDFGRAEHHAKPVGTEECLKSVWKERFAEKCDDNEWDVRNDIELELD
ncbi:hypothetical protein MMC17_004888 [Xylographa soralifera]|nr:hypothetical protein [Xylographa soralifera]